MKVFSTRELARMQETQEAAMMDSCVLMRYSESFDAMHHPVPTWTDGPVQACGLNMDSGEEIGGDGRVLVSWSASARLPLGTILDPRDRIRITSRFLQPTTQLTYEIAGPVLEGPSGLVVRLRTTDPRVT